MMASHIIADLMATLGVERQEDLWTFVVLGEDTLGSPDALCYHTMANAIEGKGTVVGGMTLCNRFAGIMRTEKADGGDYPRDGYGEFAYISLGIPACPACAEELCSRVRANRKQSDNMVEVGR